MNIIGYETNKKEDLIEFLKRKKIKLNASLFCIFRRSKSGEICLSN